MTIINFHLLAPRVLFAGVVSAVFAAPSRGQTITEIIPFPGGATATPTAVSADGGTVVGFGYTAAGTQRAFRWTRAGGAIDMGLLPGAVASNANAVNADGSVVVGASGGAVGQTTPFRWVSDGAGGGTMTAIPLPQGWPHSGAVGVSADGSVVVGNLVSIDYSSRRAFRWTAETGVVLLGGFTQSASSTIYAIGAAGDVAIGWSSLPSTNSACRWSGGASASNLGFLSGWTRSFARAMNPSGSIVVGISEGSAGQRGFRWTQGSGMESLDDRSGSVDSQALGVSGDGAMIVGAISSSDGDGAVVWTPPLGMVKLSTHLLSLGIDRGNLILTTAHAVTPDGRTIIGYGGRGAAGVDVGWIVTLPPLCRADFDGVNGVESADILSFVNAWFALDPRADFNALGGITVQDLFDFLNAWFSGC